MSKLTFLVVLCSNGLLASVSAEETQHASEDIKAKYAELSAAKEDQRLAEKLAEVKATEANATLNEKAAKVEEAKANLKIEISKEKEVSAEGKKDEAKKEEAKEEELSAVAQKDEAKEDEKLNEIVVEKAKEEEKAVEAEETKLEDETLASKGGAFTWMGRIFFVVVFASIATCYMMYTQREKAQEAMNHISNFPMMANFQKDDVDASSILFQKSPGFQSQLSQMNSDYYCKYEVMA